MARIKLNGIFDNALSGLPCLRGYAEMQILRNISEAPESYQRDKDERQMQLVTTYLKSGEHLFFPEVILACTLPTFDSEKGVDTFNSLRAKESLKLEDFSISFLKSGIANVSIDSKIKLSRIDGNHRLSAFDKNDVIATQNAPYCIVFLPEAEAGKKSEATYFYNINFKHLPLKHEHSLKILINPELNFSDKELKDMGWEFYFTRVMCKRIEDEEAFNSIKILSTNSDCYRSAIFNLCTFLIEKDVLKKNKTDFQKVSASLNKIASIYSKMGEFKGSIGLLSSLVYYELLDSKKSFAFQRWIISNHIYKIEKIDATDLVSVFGRIILSKSRQIFVSMQFDKETKPHFNAIKEAVDTVNRDHKLEIKIKQIRIDEVNKGFSYVINDEILELINESGLLIADLSPRNPNVYHELGFLMGLNEAKTLKQENFILIMKNQPDGSTDSKIGFNVRGFQQIRFDDPLSLKNSLVESLEIYFGVKVPIESKDE